MKWTLNEDLSKYGIIPHLGEKLLPFGAKSVSYQLYKIPVELLQYNLNNGRILMEVEKLQRENEIDLAQLRDESVSKFNDEIEKLIWESSVEKNQDTLEDIEKFTQLEAGVVLDDGTVIDGNRRFTCLRRLHALHPDDDRYKYFIAAIIIRDGSKISNKELKKYELKVQFGQDQKVDYKSINFAMTIYYNVKSGEFTISEIASDVNKKPSEITKIIQTSELVEELLSRFNQDKELSIAEDLNLYWPIEPLGSYLNGTEGQRLTDLQKEQRKTIFFDLLLSLDVSLPTQEFRDNLIKKIFKDNALFDELNSEYTSKFGEKFYDQFVKQKLETDQFISKIKEYRKSPEAQEAFQLYKRIVTKKNLQTHANAPLKLCEEIIERLEAIDVTPFLNADTQIANEKLDQICGKLKEAKAKTEELLSRIENRS